MIKAVLFDLDNTLIDFVKMKKIACEQAISAMIDAGLEMKKGQGMKILFTLYDKYGWENQKIFQHFLQNQQATAGEHMAAMDRHYATVNTTLADMQAQHPEVRTIVFSAHVKDHFIDAALKRGAW